MGMAVGGPKGGPMADINVTPLVDVVLVLLIIFMIVTPMLASPVEVVLPEARKSEEAKDLGSRVVVFMSEKGDLYVGRERTDRDVLVRDINDAFKTKEKRELLIKADTNLKWKDVHEVMSVIHDGGVQNMFLATRRAGEEP